ncbi:hypothetical protein ACFYVE_39295 [Streptomyces tendae]|uniref:hypothetical protein n=1 Tax=Streptomyces tendae TaxID=1932 RepID=UPI003696F2E3
MTRTIPLPHPLDDSGLRLPADLSQYHHSHFVCSEPGAWEGTVTFYFQAFTGREEEPQMPGAAYGDRSVTRDQRRLLAGEYQVARRLWSEARLRRQAVPLLREALPLWQTWTAARAHLADVFADFWKTADGHWRAQLLKLTDAEAAARSAASAFDTIACALTRLAHEQECMVPEDEELPLREVAREIGLDISDWHLAWHEDYTRHVWLGGGDRLTDHLHNDIDSQRARLREVAALAGDPNNA